MLLENIRLRRTCHGFRLLNNTKAVQIAIQFEFLDSNINIKNTVPVSSRCLKFRGRKFLVEKNRKVLIDLRSDISSRSRRGRRRP